MYLSIRVVVQWQESFYFNYNPSAIVLYPICEEYSSGPNVNVDGTNVGLSKQAEFKSNSNKQILIPMKISIVLRKTVRSSIASHSIQHLCNIR